MKAYHERHARFNERIAMSREQIIRTWKDETYRSSLSEAERAMLPEHPAGIIDLQDADLEQAAGGMMPSTQYCETVKFCTTNRYTDCS
jgi:mersacidin/lichenicidin family type 2 lantibiotic